MVIYKFKAIKPVPENKDLIDIVLTSTQRKTPTVVHSGWKISRIRSFYMRKVKFTQATFHEKFSAIIEEFPILDDIHPFYADLINVLYDKDHYKLALGQINTARQIIDNIAKDYIRLLKFGDSLFRCKQLKRAALGRMCTVLRKLNQTLQYLEHVRRHMSRLPSIDPSTRTLLICGFPNVGKSSFINKVTRAEVEVQPFAFTTKSLFVGHMDYKFQRWQVIDTPGILDHPLEERNVIEMQSITALAHLQCTVMFFIDISGECGYTIEQQASLFNNISPLFVNKPLLVVATKIDRKQLSQLDEDERALVDGMVSKSGANLCSMSNITEQGIVDVKSAACDLLLSRRVEAKLRGNKVSSFLNRLAVVEPKPRDNKVRELAIPSSVATARSLSSTAPMTSTTTTSLGSNTQLDDDTTLSSSSTANTNNTSVVRKWLERDRERAGGGPGVYKLDLKKNYLLREDEWKTDIVPEIMDGKNIADFVDPEVWERLLQLEAEEEALATADQANDEENWESDEDEETSALYEAIKEKKALIIDHHRAEKAKNRPSVPRKFQHITPDEMKAGLERGGYSDTTATTATLTAISSSRGRKRTRDGDEDNMNSNTVLSSTADAMVDVGEPSKRVRSSSAVRARQTALLGKYGGDAKAAEKGRFSKSREPRVPTAQSKGLTEELQAKAIKEFNRFRSIAFHGKQGESDRRIPNDKPKWLFSGKRGNGKTDRR